MNNLRYTVFDSFFTDNLKNYSFKVILHNALNVYYNYFCNNSYNRPKILSCDEGK